MMLKQELYRPFNSVRFHALLRLWDFLNPGVDILSCRFLKNNSVTVQGEKKKSKQNIYDDDDDYVEEQES